MNLQSIGKNTGHLIMICKHKRDFRYCDTCIKELCLDDMSPCPYCSSKDTYVFAVGDEYEMNGYFKCKECGECISLD